MAAPQFKEEKATATEDAIVEKTLSLLGPILDKIALTPDRINEIKKPYVDPVAEARKARERKEMYSEILRNIEQTKSEQDRCPHKKKIGNNVADTIQTVHNFPDGQTRGLCMVCRKWFHPDHWEIDSKGEPQLVKADPEYDRVLVIENSQNEQYLGY